MTMFNAMPDDRLMRWFNQQVRLVKSVNTGVVGLAQQAFEVRRQHLAQIEALVDSMRMTPSIVSELQTMALFRNEIQTMTAMTPTITVVEQNLQTAMQLFASLPRQVFEDLRRVQETWLQMAHYSDEFAHLQRMLGTNLSQLLCEQAAYYQTWLDKEHDKFTEAFVLCADFMLYGALGVLHNIDDAHDVVQDAYEKALRKLQTYSIEQIRSLNVRSWLYAIAKNTAKNFLRDRHSCTPYETSWMAQQPGSRFDQPEASLIRQELLQVVYETFQALPAVQHKIIFMRYFGAESSLEEIADYLGCPATTVRVYHSRGIKALRRRLSDQKFSASDLEGLIETLSRHRLT
jgi:RNA polymerase sigma factor (sigma-70 family)